LIFEREPMYVLPANSPNAVQRDFATPSRPNGKAADPLLGKGKDLYFYRKFVRDYRDDTRHLSLIEHGAYNLLLDEIYFTERCIPDDEVFLKRALGAVSEDEISAVKRVLAQFFTKTRHGWTHKRFKQELKHVESRVLASQLNGQKGGRPRKEKPSNNLVGYFEETQKKPREKATPRLTRLLDHFPQSESVNGQGAAASLQGNGNGNHNTGSAAAAELFPASIQEIQEAFRAVEAEPFGGPTFQCIFARARVDYAGSGGFADVMETTIQKALQNGVKVPGRFYTIKRRVEDLEAKGSFHRAPL